MTFAQYPWNKILDHDGNSTIRFEHSRQPHVDLIYI